ncbi:MAG: acyl--CoA ligase, partial [Oscillospiraceae bacterium]|nr:acyl--CoA ligase [Oscillospiraceae bacterium]
MRNRPYPWNDQVPLPEDFPAFFAFIEQAYGERNAFAYEREKERVEVSFAQFVTDVYALAASFRAADRQGQRYALLSENRYEWILFFFAGILAGGVAVPIDKDLPPEEIQTRLTQVQAQILVYSPEYADIAENLAVPQKINMKQLPELLALGAQAGFSRDALVPDPDAAAVIFFTSGTTGKSKGAMYSSGSLLFVAWAGIST